jgi:hypothetical protein
VRPARVSERKMMRQRDSRREGDSGGGGMEVGEGGFFEGCWQGWGFRPILEMLVTLPSGGVALLAASTACPLLT